MTDKIFVTPKPGRTVLNFTRRDMRAIDAQGEYVDNDPQWLRYADAGDIEISSSEPVKAKPSKKETI